MKQQATIGYSETVNEEIRYFCGKSKEGYIYKDEDAFKKKSGICYIPESEFDNSIEEFVTDNGYDYNELTEAVKFKIAESEVSAPKQFVEYLTENMFRLLDWSCPETFMDDVDIKEALTDWLVDEAKKHLSPDYIKYRSSQNGEDQTYGVVLCWMRDNLGVSKTVATEAAWKVLADYKLENKHYKEV